jgi:Lon protease-like protein
MHATELPIFPLHSVLFPGGLLALRVFEQRYLDMAKMCLKNGTPFGIARIREGTEVGAPAIPEDVGTTAEIGEWDMRELGILQIRARGRERFRLLSHTVARSGLLIGTVAMIPNELSGDCPELAACASFLEKVLTQTQSDHAAGARYDDASWVSFRLTELLPFNETVRQKMLELTDARIRIEILHRFLARQRLLE